MLCLDCTAIVAHAGVTTVDGIATVTATAVIVTVAVTIATAACAPTGVCRYWHWFPQELVPLSYYYPLAHSLIEQPLAPSLPFLDGTAVTAADTISTAAADADAVGIPVLLRTGALVSAAPV